MKQNSRTNTFERLSTSCRAWFTVSYPIFIGFINLLSWHSDWLKMIKNYESFYMRSKIWISDWSPAECDCCRVGYFLVVLESMRLNSRDNTWDFDTWWFMLQGDTKNDTKYDTRILTANFMDLSKIQKLYTQNLWQLWFWKISQYWKKFQ